MYSFLLAPRSSFLAPLSLLLAPLSSLLASLSLLLAPPRYTDTFKNYPAVAWVGSEKGADKDMGDPTKDAEGGFDQSLASLFPPLAQGARFLLF